jgi:1-acyl-sn-glycerol-3-phosphate acyltransferase
MRDRPRVLRAGARALSFFFVNLFIVPLYAAAVGPLRPLKRPLQVLWCRAMCGLAGVRVRVIGEKLRQGPVLFVSNHTSYLDIPVISAHVEGYFVAKAEVKDWPLFGIVARVTRTVFVRRVGSEARGQREALLSRLKTGENLILFPEGTSTDGSGVAPFKSSLFSVAEHLPPGLSLTIQPLSVTYVHDTEGVPLTGERRSLYCWYGEATMAPHIWRVLGLKGCVAELRFHPPIAVMAGDSRKRLAAAAEARVAEGVAAAHRRLLGTSAAPGVAATINAAARAAVGEEHRSAPADR